MFFERFAWQAVFSRPFFQKNYPHSLAKCLSCRCRQQREKYAVLRQEQSVSCQSKILPRCHNSPFAHSAPSESCWGVPSPNPADRRSAPVLWRSRATKIRQPRLLRSRLTRRKSEAVSAIAAERRTRRNSTPALRLYCSIGPIRQN